METSTIYVCMVKEHVEDVPHGSPKEQEVLEALQSAFLDPTFDSNWRPAKVQLIVHDQLTEEYEEKQQDFLIRGRKGDELAERWGFFVENNVAILEFLTRQGLQGRDSEYNALGYNRMGVYLSKFSDVCLQHALVKHSGSLVMRMVLCKYIAGRSTTAIPRVASAAEFIEPTQGFDSHESVINPDPRDSLQNKFDRSQVYLYEINKLLQPCSRPRQVLPFAVVSFTQNGTYLPAIDAEATAAERMASSIAQQNIANIINSKETLAPQPGASVAPNPGAAMMTSPAGAVISQALAGSPQMPPGSVQTAGLTSPPTINTSTQSTPLQNGTVTTNGNIATPSPTDNAPQTLQQNGTGGEENDPLKNAVSQLNVKLGNEIIKRPGVAGSSMGHIIAHPASVGLPQIVRSPAPTTVVSASAPIASVPQFANHPYHHHHQTSNPYHQANNPYHQATNPYHQATNPYHQPTHQFHQASHPYNPAAAGLSRVVQLPNGLQMMFPQQAVSQLPGLPPGMMTMAGLQGLQGLHGAGLQTMPGLHGAVPGTMLAGGGMIPGQPGLLPSSAAAAAQAQAAAGLLPNPGAQGHPMFVSMAPPAAVPRHPTAMIPGMPGAGIMGSVPAGATLQGLQGAMPGAMPGTMPGALPQPTRSPSQTLGQSRPITPEVPTAGYVANNVSGYTPAALLNHNGVPQGGIGGQPIPVLANGSVVTSGAHVTMPQAVSMSYLFPGMGQNPPMMSMAGTAGMMTGTSVASGMSGMAGMGGLQAGAFQTIPGLQQQPQFAGLAGMAGASLGGMGGLIPAGYAGMGLIPAGAGAGAFGNPAVYGAPAQHTAQQMAAAAAFQPAFTSAAAVSANPAAYVPMKYPGQNGLLQQQQMSMAGIPGMTLAAAPQAPTLKRPITDPYAVIDKRLRLA